MRTYRIGVYVDNQVTVEGLQKLIDAINYRLRVFAPGVEFRPEDLRCSRWENWLCWTVEYPPEQWVESGTLIYQALLQVERFDSDLHELRDMVRDMVVHLYYRNEGSDRWVECA